MLRAERIGKWRLLLAATAIAMLLPSLASGQANGCVYDSLAPTIPKAQEFLSDVRFDCAEKVLMDLIRLDSSKGRPTAAAHGWLAVTYCAWAKFEIDKYSAAFEQFMSALQADPNYRPETVQEVPKVDSVYQAARDTLATRRERMRVTEQLAAQRDCEHYASALGRRKLLRIGAAVGTVGATVGAVLMNNKANSAYDEYSAAVSPTAINSAWDSYTSRYHMRNILIGIAGTFLATEVYFTLKKPRAPARDCSDLSEAPPGPKLGVGFSDRAVYVAIRLSGL